MLDNPNVDRASRRRASTRREILDAAWDVVHQDGFGGLTVRAVAARVGMRAPSLYGHFPSKAGILDAMFGEAWQDLHAVRGQLEGDLPAEPRAALLSIARLAVDYFTADPERYALMNQRPVPGFVPSADAYAPALRTIEWLGAELSRLGVTDPDAVDLWTALLAGIVNQQLANDAGGDRWTRLLPRAVQMYADEVGLPSSPARTRRAR